MSQKVDVGTVVGLAIAALVIWSLYQSFINPSEPNTPQPGEICDYYDADPTQYSDMFMECYVP